MKKIKSLCLISILAFLLTGCVKFNANMDIKKDKSMDFSIIYAMDTSVFGEMEALDADAKKELEEQGFTITEYSKDSMQGYTLTKKIKNIDEVSSSEDVQYDLSGILNTDTDEEKSYIFKVKKGIFKNTYTAKFEFDSADSNLNTTTDTDETEDTEDDFDWYDTDEDESDFSTDTEEDYDWSFDTEDEDEEENNTTPNFGNLDFSSMMSNMDLSFNVTLPYAAKSNNATNVNNDNKSLSWTLSSQGESEIAFEFELYNMMSIYIIFGAVVLAIIVVIVLIILNKKKNNKDSFSQTDTNVDTIEQQPMNTAVAQQTNQASIWQTSVQQDQFQQVENSATNQTDYMANSSQILEQPTEIPVQPVENNVINQNNYVPNGSQIPSQQEVLGQNMVNSTVDQVNYAQSGMQNNVVQPNLTQTEQNVQTQPPLQPNNINHLEQTVNQANNYTNEQNSNNINNNDFKW